jgi:hypothetical protein
MNWGCRLSINQLNSVSDSKVWQQKPTAKVQVITTTDDHAVFMMGIQSNQQRSTPLHVWPVRRTTQ